jgi:hypothetical protein
MLRCDKRLSKKRMLTQIMLQCSVGSIEVGGELSFTIPDDDRRQRVHRFCQLRAPHFDSPLPDAKQDLAYFQDHFTVQGVVGIDGSLITGWRARVSEFRERKKSNGEIEG